MSSVSNTKSSTRRRLIRGIALLFLIHGALDLASLHLVEGETPADSRQVFAVASPQLTSAASPTVAGSEASVKQRTNEPSEQPSEDHHSHVLPVRVTATIAVTDIRSPATIPEYHSVLSPPLNRAYHPPRFA